MDQPLTNVFGAYEAKTHFSKLLDRVASGEEITITKHGTAVARIVPIRRSSSSEERKVAIEHWIQSAKGLSLGGLKIHDIVSEGRR